MTLDELEEWYGAADLPPSLVLASGVTCNDIPKMVSSHIAVLRAQGLVKGYLPYYNRLLFVRQLLIHNFGASPPEA